MPKRTFTSRSRKFDVISAIAYCPLATARPYPGTTTTFCAEGFMLNQPLLTTVGALIGASGAILTHVMCVAMNRDIASVLLGGYGTSSTGSGEAMVFEGEARFTDIDTTVERLTSAQNVVVVPGYGLSLIHI